MMWPRPIAHGPTVIADAILSYRLGCARRGNRRPSERTRSPPASRGSCCAARSKPGPAARRVAARSRSRAWCAARRSRRRRAGLRQSATDLGRGDARGGRCVWSGRTALEGAPRNLPPSAVRAAGWFRRRLTEPRISAGQTDREHRHRDRRCQSSTGGLPGRGPSTRGSRSRCPGARARPRRRPLWRGHSGRRRPRRRRRSRDRPCPTIRRRPRIALRVQHDHAASDLQLGMGDPVVVGRNHEMLLEAEGLGQPRDRGGRVLVPDRRKDIRVIGHERAPLLQAVGALWRRGGCWSCKDFTSASGRLCQVPTDRSACLPARA
jgi:hypothetical protein